MTTDEQIIKKRESRRKLSIEEKIGHLSKKLSAARAKQRKQEEVRRRQSEKNVIKLLKGENLLAFHPEIWKAALPEIRHILDRKESTVATQAAQEVNNTSNGGNSVQ